MTVATSTNRVQYTGNGATTVFAYSFRIYEDGDLVVTLTDTDGVETVKTLTTHYTVSGAGSLSGGNVTMLTAPPSGYKLTIRRVLDLVQETDVRNQGAFYPEIHEDAFDRSVMVDQQQQEEIDRAFKLPVTIGSASFDPTMPASLVDSPGATVMVNADGDGFEEGPTADEISGAQASAVAAAASATAAQTAETNAETAEANAEAAQAAAEAAQAAAETAQALAEAAADSVIWNDVVFLTSADSPRAITDADKGKLFVCDCTSGNIVINLPAISGLTLSSAWAAGFKKSDAGANTVTINRNGTDTIDGDTSKTLVNQNDSTVLIPDTDPSPDTWASVSAGYGVADNSITLEKMEHGTQGDILYYGASGAPARLSAGTIGQVLLTQGAGANPAWGNAGGVTLGTPVATTSGTAIDFTGIPAGVKRIKIMFNNVSTTGTSEMIVQIGPSGGLETTGYRSEVSYSNVTKSGTAAFLIQYVGVAADLCSGIIELCLMDASTNLWTESGHLVGGAGHTNNSSGSKALADVLSQLRLTTAGGTATFDNGSVNISYES